MPDDLEARHLRHPVDGGHVEEEIEAEFGLEPAHDREQRFRGQRQHQNAVRECGGGGARGERFGDAIEDAGGHGQKSLVTIGWLERAISACSCMMPSITISGRGGHPGT